MRTLMCLLLSLACLSCGSITTRRSMSAPHGLTIPVPSGRRVDVQVQANRRLLSDGGTKRRSESSWISDLDLAASVQFRLVPDAWLFVTATQGVGELRRQSGGFPPKPQAHARTLSVGAQVRAWERGSLSLDYAMYLGLQHSSGRYSSDITLITGACFDAGADCSADFTDVGEGSDAAVRFGNQLALNLKTTSSLTLRFAASLHTHPGLDPEDSRSGFHIESFDGIAGGGSLEAVYELGRVAVVPNLAWYHATGGFGGHFTGGLALRLGLGDWVGRPSSAP